MQNEKQQRITLQMMHMSARFNLYWFFLGEPILLGAIGDDCPLTTCDILSGCGLEQEGRGMKVENCQGAVPQPDTFNFGTRSPPWTLSNIGIPPGQKPDIFLFHL